MNLSLILEPLERWWVGAIQDGDLMPFGERVSQRNLGCRRGGNQPRAFSHRVALAPGTGQAEWADPLTGPSEREVESPLDRLPGFRSIG